MTYNNIIIDIAYVFLMSFIYRIKQIKKSFFTEFLKEIIIYSLIKASVSH